MRSVASVGRGGVRFGRLLALALVSLSAIAVARADEPRLFEVAVRDGAVARERRVLKVTQHERVRIVWAADAPLVVHLEGYDLSKTVRPDQPQAMEFQGYAAGRFPLHAHAADAVRQGQGHAHGRGVLLGLEVHPR